MLSVEILIFLNFLLDQSYFKAQNIHLNLFTLLCSQIHKNEKHQKFNTIFRLRNSMMNCMFCLNYRQINAKEFL